MTQMNEDNWQAIMTAYGFTPNVSVCAKLINVHAGRGRFYHTTEHISACLRHLEEVKGQVHDWKSMALAFWFHDAVYKTFSSTNERDSADWAVTFMRTNQADPVDIMRVENLIMATAHNAANLAGDVALLVDIDLSILGAPQPVYDVYETNIRKEYRLVPKAIYRKKRAALLQSFLDKSNIYGSDFFQNKFEAQARHNLARAVNLLTY